VTVTGPQGAKTFVTDAEGRFSAPFLTPGVYSVGRNCRASNRLRPARWPSGWDRPPGLDLTMQVGGLTETVQVTGNLSTIDTPRPRSARCSTPTTCGADSRGAHVQLDAVPGGGRPAVPAPPARQTRRISGGTRDVIR